jgi:hypothetical protein
MGTIASALRQAVEFVQHSKRWVLERQDIFKLEDQYGELDDPSWLLSEEYYQLCEKHRMHLDISYESLSDHATSRREKRICIKWFKRQVRRLESILAIREQDPVYHPFATPEYAYLQVTRFFLGSLKGRIFMPKDYETWRDSIDLNPLWEPKFLPDEVAFQNPSFWVDSQTRLVFLHDRMEVRWRLGRILKVIAYDTVSTLKKVIVRRRLCLEIVKNSGGTELIDVSWVGNFDQLEKELVSKGLTPD